MPELNQKRGVTMADSGMLIFTAVIAFIAGLAIGYAFGSGQMRKAGHNG